MPLVDALTLFGRSNQLNIMVGPEVQGTVTVDFQGLSLEKAMQALLDAHGYYWSRDGELIRVRRFETRLFTLDYIRLIRGGEGRSEAQVTPGSSQGGVQRRDAGSIALNQEDEIRFWEELEGQLETLMSEEGRLVVNRLSGTVQITDVHQRVEDIARFLATVRRSLYRQVEIEARIYEVTLSDNYSLGIDWNQVDLLNIGQTAGTLALSNIVTAPFGGFMATAATSRLSFQGGSFDVVLEALREQGDLKVVSQPRIVTLNNQPALIKVATDQSFFISTTTAGTGGSPPIITEQVRTVSAGLVLSVTPQISEDGWIMLDVSPIITRLTDIVTSPNGSTAPILDVKQSAGLVRLRDGEMVIIGGLIQDQVSETERKVPLLGDIPGLGLLFRGTFHVKEKSELVIFLSPKIIEAG